MSQASSVRPSHQPIRRLPPAVIARIAAGEVITHPADVVRELVENALDAHAGNIHVEITTGGLASICVHDDGDGIPLDDAHLLFTRHATSKGDHHNQLAGISSLGFRGEGLASIATVAQVVLRSRHTSDDHGFSLATGPQTPPAITWIARQHGTSVEVHDLFSGYPVRRRALVPATIQREVRHTLLQLAIARPDVAMRLDADERMLATTPGSTRDGLLAAVCEASTLDRLVQLPTMQGNGWSLDGIVAPPGTHLRGLDGVAMSVNGRRTNVEPLLSALQRAWSRLFPRQRLPFAALWLQVDPQRVDVNIHPAKAHVLIDDVAPIVTALNDAIEQHLGRATWRARELRPLALDLGRFTSQPAQLAEDTAAYDSDHTDAQAWSRVTIEPGTLPALSLVGHVGNTLLVCESAHGTLLVDQHRAHERVIHDRLLAATFLPLEQPATVALPAHLADLLAHVHDDLARVGWRLEQQPGRVHIHAIPPGLESDDLLPLLRLQADNHAHSVLASVACQAALRKHRALDQPSAVELLRALTTCTQPATCPHGQPIILHLDRAFLERQFQWR